MDGIKTVRVRVQLMLDVDPEAWTLEHGVEGRRNIQNDVKEYIRAQVQGLENITLAGSK